MALFGRRKRPGVLRTADREDLTYLEEWARARRGVEAFVEPRTTVTETTVLLVASTGEWTRRRVPDPRAAAEFAKRLAIPVYDAAVVGYPGRMREWNARQKPASAGDAALDS
ncbi:MAG: hypothetical protein ACJ735_00570 [Actinomycetes bacterium]